MSRLRLVEQATAPATPGSGEVVLYADSSSNLSVKNDAGTVYGLGGTGILTIAATGTAATVVSNTWTPDLKFGGVNTGITYTSRYGLYCKVGDICFFQGAIVLSSKGAAAGAASIYGLPFTARNLAGAYPPVTVQWLNMTTSLVAAGGVIYLNDTKFDVNGAAAATATLLGLANTDFANNTSLRFQGAYIV